MTTKMVRLTSNCKISKSRGFSQWPNLWLKCLLCFFFKIVYLNVCQYCRNKVKKMRRWRRWRETLTCFEVASMNNQELKALRWACSQPVGWCCLNWAEFLNGTSAGCCRRLSDFFFLCFSRWWHCFWRCWFLVSLFLPPNVAVSLQSCLPAGGHLFSLPLRFHKNHNFHSQPSTAANGTFVSSPCVGTFTSPRRRQTGGEREDKKTIIKNILTFKYFMCRRHEYFSPFSRCFEKLLAVWLGLMMLPPVFRLNGCPFVSICV